VPTTAPSAPSAPSLSALRRYAIARTLFRPTTLARAIDRLGFVQADPIRAPARAQDLTLRHRVADYRAGDLERRYPRLAIEEDFFVNYGFLPRAHHALMHPRTPRTPWTAARRRQADAVLAFIAQRGAAHPREVDAHFAHGKVRNWFGGTSNASTQLLDDMHYRGLLRVARREGGTRVYAVRAELAHAGDTTVAHAQASRAAPAQAPVADSARDAQHPRSPARRMDALVDLIARLYAPLPAASLGQLVRHLGGGAPQWAAQRAQALARAKQRLAHARVDGTDWYWPADEHPAARRWRTDDAVRLLAPFDPVVWDRRRFEIFWGWTYRFEAYTPPARRRLGYYALPILWREQVVGWSTVKATDSGLAVDCGYVDPATASDRPFRAALDEELDRLQRFLGPNSPHPLK
jgi:uncharacterized protein YcaQ